MPYFICEDCDMSYEVDSGEDPSLYMCSQCDGPLIYVEKLAEYGRDPETSEITKIGSSTFTEKMVSRYNFIMYIAAAIFLLSALALYFGYYLAILPLLAFSGVIVSISSRRRSWKKGDKGEKIVAWCLDELTKCIIFNDVNLPQGRGNIDHVILSPNGLFVLETKNYKGRFAVKGDEWFYKKDKRIIKSKSNPGKQIKRNALSLKKFLDHSMDMDKVWINSLVVMVNGHVDIIDPTPHYNIIRPSQIERAVKIGKSKLDLDTIYSLSCLLQDYSSEMVYRAGDWPEEWTQ
ncbi:MAG: NERD domain-containing protein [Euryarchaeota archaeon]|nr:NERD domain-containing protein [Euryarchaeota archaeon]MBU4608518.1 NERD domain-containing protein [Euryarchaeota archaeon]MBV1754485.1 NERD domain-containing protein [Methanobacterium sp.]